VIEVREYLRPDGRSPFQDWLEDLDSQTRRRVTTHLYRVALGNFSSVKGVGKGVFETRLDAGPGYRIYFGKD
jgi:putative addiction module killer protein